MTVEWTLYLILGVLLYFVFVVKVRADALIAQATIVSNAIKAEMQLQSRLLESLSNMEKQISSLTTYYGADKPRLRVVLDEETQERLVQMHISVNNIEHKRSTEF